MHGEKDWCIIPKFLPMRFFGRQDNVFSTICAHLGQPRCFQLNLCSAITNLRHFGTREYPFGWSVYYGYSRRHGCNWDVSVGMEGLVWALRHRGPGKAMIDLLGSPSSSSSGLHPSANAVRYFGSVVLPFYIDSRFFSAIQVFANHHHFITSSFRLLEVSWCKPYFG